MKRVDATEDLANIILQTASYRRQRYAEIESMIPLADLNAKVVTIEDEYVPEGKYSRSWNLPGVFTVFEAFIRYEYVPLMSDLLENADMRIKAQQLMKMFLDYGAEIDDCQLEIMELVQDARAGLADTERALALVGEICHGFKAITVIR